MRTVTKKEFKSFKSLIPETLVLSIEDNQGKDSMELEDAESWLHMEIAFSASAPVWWPENKKCTDLITEGYAQQSAYIGEDEVTFTKEQLNELSALVADRVSFE